MSDCYYFVENKRCKPSKNIPGIAINVTVNKIISQKEQYQIVASSLREDNTQIAIAIQNMNLANNPYNQFNIEVQIGNFSSILPTAVSDLAYGRNDVLDLIIYLQQLENELNMLNSCGLISKDCYNTVSADIATVTNLLKKLEVIYAEMATLSGQAEDILVQLNADNNIENTTGVTSDIQTLNNIYSQISTLVGPANTLFSQYRTAIQKLLTDVVTCQLTNTFVCC